MDQIFRDLQFTLRSMRKEPAWTFAVLLTLALATTVAIGMGVVGRGVAMLARDLFEFEVGVAGRHGTVRTDAGNQFHPAVIDVHALPQPARREIRIAVFGPGVNVALHAVVQVGEIDAALERERIAVQPVAGANRYL